MKRIRNYFIAGLIVLFPVLATWQLLVWLFNLLDGQLRGVVARYVGHDIPGVGLVITLLVVFLVGLLAANYFGRRVIGWGEAAMRRTPIVRSIYVTMKQITDAFVRQDKSAFKRVALIEYPRRGIYCLAFVTSAAPEEIGARIDTDLVGVFLPTTPNPTSGFLLYLPRHDVRILDISVEDGLKLVISGGVFIPEARRFAPPADEQGGGRAG